MSLQGILIRCLVLMTFMASCRKADDLTPNVPPVAVAGPLLPLKTGDTVLLDGSGSYDANHDSLYFSWTFISKPEASTVKISGFDQKIATFIADHTGEYIVRLLVSDGIDSGADTVKIMATGGNLPPVAKAGDDLSADLGDKISLDGSSSFDPEGSSLTYSWTILSQPPSSASVLTSPNSASSEIVIDKAGTYKMMLTVSDGILNSSDTVSVFTNPPEITGIDPKGGTSGTEVVITGKNFDNSSAGNDVFFNGKPAIVLEATFTQLKVTAPVGAGTGTVSLTTGDVTVTGPVFTYYAVVQSWATVSSPVMLARDAAGNIFVSGYNTHVIYIITPDAKVSIYAGTGQQGYQDGKVETAMFSNPAGLAVDASGNLFVADYGNHCIRMINTSGVVSTFAGFPQAGYQDGQGGQAQFNYPAGLTIDGAGNLYVTEVGNDRVRKITPAAMVSTVAGSGVDGFGEGKGTNAMFSNPIGIAMDQNGNLIIADAGNNRIRKIDPSGQVTTLAGDGTAGFKDGAASSAQFNLPYGLTIDDQGRIYIADMNNNRIRMITGNEVSTYAGNGTKADVDGIAPEASFNNPSSILFDASTGILYVTDFGSNKIKKILPE